MRGYKRHLHPGPCGKRCRNPAKWEIRVYAGRDPITGRKRYVSRTVAGLRAAEDALAKLVAEHGQGHHRVTPAEVTVEELLWRWWRHARPDLSPGGADAAEVHIRLYLAPRLGATRLAKLTGPDIGACYDHLRQHGGMCQPCRARARAGRPPLRPGVKLKLWRRTVTHQTDCATGLPLAPSYVRRIHATLHAALEYARTDLGWISVNPAGDLRRGRLKGRSPAITPPSDTDVTRLLAAAAERDFEWFCWLMLAATLGARRGEVVAVRWSRIDFERGKVLVSHMVVHGRDPATGKRALLEKPTTKEDKPKEPELDRLTLRLLRELRRRQQERAFALGVPWTDAAYCFSPDVAGQVPYRPDGMTARFRRLRSSLGLDRVRLHDLRHWAASQMLRGGIDPVRAAHRTGHDPKTMLRVYGHYVGGDAESAELLAGLLASDRLIRAAGDSR